MQLSQHQYNQLQSFKPIRQTEVYYHLQSKANDVLLNITNRFYETHNFNEDNNEQRKNAYKMALAAQIEYFYEMEQTTIAGVNRTPQTMSLGRTTVSM